MDKKDLLISFYNGSCSSEEAKFLLDHLQPEDVEQYEEVVRELWDRFLIHPPIENDTSERMYGRIASTAHITRSTKKATLKKFYRAAAVFTGFILATGIVLFILDQTNRTMYRTAYGEKKTILLADSSEIMLNANSALTLKKSDFNKKNREVWIEGEVYFDISPNRSDRKRRTFVVHANDVDVEVIGTKFNVNARRNTTKVALEEGKVQLNLGNQKRNPIIMEPGDYVAYSGMDNKFERKIVDPYEYSSWRNNVLFFNEVPLELIAQAVEDHFGYKVHLMDFHLRQKKYKGAFPTDNLDVLLESLARSFDLRVDVDGNDIWMRK